MVGRTWLPEHEWRGMRFPDVDGKTWEIVEAWMYDVSVGMGFVAVLLKDDEQAVVRDMNSLLGYTNAVEKICLSHEEVCSIVSRGCALHLSNETPTPLNPRKKLVLGIGAPYCEL